MVDSRAYFVPKYGPFWGDAELGEGVLLDPPPEYQVDTATPLLIHVSCNNYLSEIKAVFFTAHLQLLTAWGHALFRIAVIGNPAISVNTKCLKNARLMLGQRRRRRPNINPALFK